MLEHVNDPILISHTLTRECCAKKCFKICHSLLEKPKLLFIIFHFVLTEIG